VKNITPECCTVDLKESETLGYSPSQPASLNENNVKNASTTVLHLKDTVPDRPLTKTEMLMRRREELLQKRSEMREISTHQKNTTV